MPDEKGPQFGGLLSAFLMHFCSGKPMHFCSGVDTPNECLKMIQIEDDTKTYGWRKFWRL